MSDGYTVDHVTSCVSHGKGYNFGSTSITVDYTTKWLLENVLDDVGRIGVGEKSIEGLLLALVYLYGDDIDNKLDDNTTAAIQEWFDDLQTQRRRAYKNVFRG